MSKYPALRLAGQTSGGDPRALLVDSGGRPIVTAPSVEDKLDIIKDEQGRLWGWDPDEDKWRKVKVNSQGKLELAQEITIESPTINIGSSVEINNDEENPVPVQLSGSLPARTPSNSDGIHIRATEGGALAPRQINKVVLTVDKPCILWDFQFAPNHRVNVEFEIRPRLADGTLGARYFPSTIDVNGAKGSSIDDLTTLPVAGFDVINDGTPAGVYRAVLTKDIVFGNGFVVRLHSLDSIAQKAAIHAMWTVL